MKMSQNWHGHWTEDTFRPRNLCNWQVPQWHPKWPDRHCGSSKVQVDDSGRFLRGLKPKNLSPWGDFKGTWDLPLKITRKIANELSAPPKHKYDKWQAHLTRNKAKCEENERKKKEEQGLTLSDDRDAHSLDRAPSLQDSMETHHLSSISTKSNTEKKK